MYLQKITSFMLPVIAGLFFVWACNSDNGSDNNDSDDIDSADTDVGNISLNQAQKVFYALPSPFEVAALLKNSGVAFDREFLNPADNLSNYTTSKSKALNLGVYGADLSFASMFDQTQASIVYMSAVRKLCDELGISSAFTPKTMERLEANKDNQDSIQQIVSDAYLEANSYLKENERDNTSALILAGGWVEGLYIATRLYDPESPNEDLQLMIAEQKYSLENLISLLESYEGGNNEEILNDLQALNDVYGQFDEGEIKIEHQTSENGGMTIIGGDDEINLSDEQLASIAEKIETIRGAYIQ